MDPAVHVELVPERNRYEVRLEDRLVGIADYMDREGERLFTHTEVDPSVGGRGIGTALVRYALEDTRASGKRVIPLCSFVAAHAA